MIMMYPTVNEVSEMTGKKWPRLLKTRLGPWAWRPGGCSEGGGWSYKIELGLFSKIFRDAGRIKGQ